MGARGVVIAILVAAVVGLIALLLWNVRGGSDDDRRAAGARSDRPPAATAATRDPARAAPPPAPPSDRKPPTLPEPVPVPPPPTDDGFPAMHDARARVLAAARDCIDTPPDGDIPDESLELKYTIETGGGDAEIRNVEISTSTLSDELIPKCVAERLAGLRWRIADQEEHRFTIRDTFALRELVQ